MSCAVCEEAASSRLAYGQLNLPYQTESISYICRAQRAAISSQSIARHTFMGGPMMLTCDGLPLHRRYGLVGPNGSGKSTLLKALGNREVPIPEHIDIYFLDREIPASDMTALEAVMSVDQERQRLEKEAEGLIADESEEAQSRLEDLYERCAYPLAISCPLR